MVVGVFECLLGCTGWSFNNVAYFMAAQLFYMVVRMLPGCSECLLGYCYVFSRVFWMVINRMLLCGCQGVVVWLLGCTGWSCNECCNVVGSGVLRGC